MSKLHPIQIEMLKKLLFSKSLRYTDLRTDEDMENNQLSFHLNKLVENEWVEKTDDQYSLTPKGKEFANQMDTEKLKIDRQAKLSAWIACVRESKSGEKEFLFYTRLKHPFYGRQGFMSGKINYGDQVLETAVRELEEETGLTGQAKLAHIRHYRVYNPEQELLEDKFMFLCVIEDPTGKLQEKSAEGEYMWVAESKWQERITNPFESVESFSGIIDIVKNYKHGTNPSFIELDHTEEDF